MEAEKLNNILIKKHEQKIESKDVWVLKLQDKKDNLRCERGRLNASYEQEKLQAHGRRNIMAAKSGIRPKQLEFNFQEVRLFLTR